MKKYAVCIGEVDGKPVVVIDPTTDTDAVVKKLREITDAGGVTKIGSKKVTVSDAVILHTSKGVIKRRKGMDAVVPAGAGGADEQE